MREPRQNIGLLVGNIVVERDAVARHGDRGRDQIGEREMAGAVFLLGQRQARHRAGHADGERRRARLLRIGVALVVEEALGVDRRRRGLAIVDGGIPAAGKVNHHEAAAADIAGARIADGERETDRDGGIHRIAALLQDVDADMRRAGLLGHHHAVAGGDRHRLRNCGLRLTGNLPGKIRRRAEYRDGNREAETHARSCRAAPG